MVAVDWKFVEEISRFGRDDELLELNHGEPRKKRVSAGRCRGQLGDVTGRENGIALHDDNARRR